MRLRRAAVCLAFLAMCTVSLGSPASADLTGHWYAEQAGSGGGSVFDVVQSGNTVTIPLSIFYSGFGTATMDATRDGDALDAAGFAPSSPSSEFHGRVLASEDVLDGNFTFVAIPNVASLRLLATRCECFDGNTDNGDGCDASCRVEPCFECSGEPSTCTPLGDGAACNDHQDCTTGETCTAGACGGGSAAPSCIDMTGRWEVVTTGGSAGYLVEDLRDVEQRDGFLRFRRPTLPAQIAEVGTIDQGTRAVALSGGVVPGAIPYIHASLNSAIEGCLVTYTGTVSADGQTLAGSGSGGVGEIFTVGTIGAQFYNGCRDDEVFAFAQTARRCGVGECLVVAEECPPCHTRNLTGTCVPGPRPICQQLSNPRRSKTRISTTDPLKQRFSWRWSDAAEVPEHLLGDIPAGTGIQFCVFDGSSNVLFQTRWFNHDDHYGYWLNYGWETKDGLTFSRPGQLGGKESITLRSNARKGTLVSLLATEPGLGNGVDPYSVYSPPDAGLPASPFTLPLVIQAQVDRGGACFVSTFGEDGVRENADGEFKAKATE